MDDTKKQAWVDGLRNLWRQWSMQFAVVWTSAIAYYLTLPAVCDPTAAACVSQTGLLSHLPFPPWVLPYLVGLLPQLFLRAAPQALKTPATPEEPKQ